MDSRTLLVSGGVGAGVRPAATTPADAVPAPRDARSSQDAGGARDDWHVELLGVTWLRIPEGTITPER